MDNKNIKSILEKINTYAAGFAIIIPAFVAFATIVFKFFSFCYTKGQTDYFNLDPYVIELFSENIVFEISFAVIMFIVFIFCTYIFYLPLNPKDKLTIPNMLALLFLSALLVFGIFGLLLVGAENIRLIFILSVASFLCAIIITIMRKQLKDSKRKESFAPNAEKKGTFQNNVVTYLTFSVIIMATISSNLYFQGQSVAKKKQNFRLINSNKIIIYETSDKYYTARCNINGSSIIIMTNFQTEQDKHGIETELKRFALVTVQ